tara:strand:+ start:1299 stop:2552 length:1254 start_codon:yes stop_codon:yes gene_type:complete
VLLGAEGKRVDVDTSIGVASVVLERLNEVEVGSFALREAVLTVKLELSGDNRVLTPAVHLKSRLGKNKGTGVRDTVVDRLSEGLGKVGDGGSGKVSTSGSSRASEGISEKTGAVNNGVVWRAIIAVKLLTRGEGADGVGEGINGIGVVKRLSTEGGVEDLTLYERIAVADIVVRLDNPDNLFAWVVEIELNLVAGRTDGFGASELKLLNEVLVGILSHTSALIGIEENVIDVKRGGYERFAVATGGFDILVTGTDLGDGEKALVHRAELDVDLDLMVLKSNEGKSKTGVAAEPELKGNVESGLGKSLSRGAYSVRNGSAGASSGDLGELGVGKVGKLSGVTNHLVETILLLGSKSELVPDVHPVTVLSVDALTTDLNLNHRNELVSRVVEPSSVNIIAGVVVLVNLRNSDLKVCSVG